jgi:hypothetical protein
VKVNVYVSPGARLPDFNGTPPEVETTVWCTLSVLTQVTVLLTPMTTTMLLGEKPGASRGFEDPGSIATKGPIAVTVSVRVVVAVSVSVIDVVYDEV